MMYLCRWWWLYLPTYIFNHLFFLHQIRSRWYSIRWVNSFPEKLSTNNLKMLWIFYQRVHLIHFLQVQIERSLSFEEQEKLYLMLGHLFKNQKYGYLWSTDATIEYKTTLYFDREGLVFEYNLITGSDFSLILVMEVYSIYLADDFLRWQRRQRNFCKLFWFLNSDSRDYVIEYEQSWSKWKSFYHWSQLLELIFSSEIFIHYFLTNMESSRKIGITLVLKE